MNKFEIVEVGEKVYAFEMLPPEGAMMISLRFVEAFGGIISSFIPVLKVDSEDFDIFNINIESLNIEEIQDAFMSASSLVVPEKIKPIFDAILPSVFITDKSLSGDKGHRCTYDDFNGKIKTLYKVLFYALRYNFSDFFVESA